VIARSYFFMLILSCVKSEQNLPTFLHTFKIDSRNFLVLSEDLLCARIVDTVTESITWLNLAAYARSIQRLQHMPKGFSPILTMW
jgi:hypothetical protein